MPAKSKAQLRYLFAKKPALGKEFADATPSIKALPNHVGDRNNHKSVAVTKAAVKRLRKRGLKNEHSHMAAANRKTPFDAMVKGGPVQYVSKSFGPNKLKGR